MELFTMGPKRGRDQAGQDEPAESLEPLELGSDLDDAEISELPDVPVGSRHWWGELVRADVLAVGGAGALVMSVLGLPFTKFLANFYFIPIQISTAWVFLPLLIAAGVATALGLGAVRQAFRHDAATWVRVVGGATALVGFLLLVGTAVTWLYAVESGLVEDMGTYF
jgi:hypothetical protein